METGEVCTSKMRTFRFPFTIVYSIITAELPPQKMLDAVKNLIALGIENGHIEKNYTLIGHRQVRNTECPGTRLFEEISKWQHFSLDVE